jgi:hypothetical protein
LARDKYEKQGHEKFSLNDNGDKVVGQYTAKQLDLPERASAEFYRLQMRA